MIALSSNASLKGEQGARLMALVIGSEHRGVRSVGQALISAAEDWARQRGTMEVMLTTHKHRADAHRFYKSLGFEATGYLFYKVL